MICSNCATANDASRKFCQECGTRLAIACPSCGAANAPEARFCGECGAAFAVPAKPASETLPVPQLSAAAAPAAERRLVSVLFADLVGFTPFAEERDPEAVRDVLTRYFDLARLAVERHGGTVEKFIGDAVMAVWGTPVAHEDDAERAVRAALEMVGAVHDLEPGLDARAGVMTGETAVTLGAVGQGMVAGDLVNTAARIQSVAAPGTVLVGQATMGAASAAIAFEPAGPQELKGKTSPVPAWRALRVVAQRGGQGRGEALEPPFVGREDELRLLKDALHATGRERRVRLVSISGPAGIGKSRLAWELEKYIDGVVEDIYWHRGRSPSYGEGIAFWALGEMVRRRAGLAETDDEATTRSGIRAVVAEHVGEDEDRRWVEPALLALLGLDQAPAGGRDALFAGWRILFENVARRGTTVLLFEDLQWADAGLLDFIEHLLDWSKGAPILIITLARPELFERRPEWGAGMRRFTAVTLDPLSEDAMRALLAGFVPGLPETTVAAILKRADGIPLYAVETVRMLVAEGRLELADGGYRPVGDLTQISIPETLRSLIAARLDAIDAADRRLLQDASILGRTFVSSALAAITGGDEADLEPRLRALVRREILELEADPRSAERGQYGFVQSLIREVAYDTLAKRDRRARHLAAARHFEALGDDQLAGVLASHYLAAYQASAEGPEADALAAQARLALRGAAERAAALGGHDQAVAYLEEALGITPAPPERAELLERAAGSADAAARYSSAIDYARRAIEAHAETGDRRAVGRASALLGAILIDSGDLAQATRVLEDALADLADEEALEEVKAALLAHHSRAMFRSDDNGRAVESADRALTLAERLNLDQVVAEAFVNKGTALFNLGRRRESAAILEGAVRLAEAGGWIASELRARHNLSDWVFRDEPQRALEIAGTGLELARRVGSRSNTFWLTGLIADFAYQLGEGWDGALAAVEEILGTATPAPDRLRLLCFAGFIRIARGDGLAGLIGEMETLAEHVSDVQQLALLEMARSEVALAGGDPTKAYEAALRANELWGGWAGSALPMAVRAAVHGGSLERARRAAELLEALPLSDTLYQANRAWAAAGLAVLEGRRDDAAVGFRTALGAFREMRLDFYMARTGLDMVLLLGADEPEARAAAEEARPIFGRLRARPYLERLETALTATSSGTGDAIPQPAVRVSP